MSDPQTVRSPFPLAKADLCVKCGLCLPHCPTYQQTEHEAESPRGRIALMQALASGTLAPGASLQAHLDHCLGCRACEKVCPAQVPYGELIDAGRALLQERTGRTPRLTRWLMPWLSSARRRRWLRTALRCAQRLAPERWLARGRWRSLLPAAQRTAPIGRFQAQPRSTRVALLRGCVGDIADSATLDAVQTLLGRVGLQLLDTAQHCCGALAQHAGLPAQTQPLIERNLQAWRDADYVTYAASGCGATLHDYPQLHPQAADLRTRLIDPHRLLLDHWPADIALQPLPVRAALHLPCTQSNVLGQSDAIRALLRRIPELALLEIAGSACCGAAGTYFLTQPAMADALLDHKLDAIAALQPQLLLSSNIGCTLHLAAGLRRRGLKVPVVHPLELLARQWPDGAAPRRS